MEAEQYPQLERFEIRRQLGSGGFGVVYEAWDRDQEAVVALKMLRHLSSDAIRLFKAEFRVLARFVHPNLVSLYELICEQDQWFFTMELVEGGPWMEYVRPGYELLPNRTFNLSLVSEDFDRPLDYVSHDEEVFPDQIVPYNEARLRATLKQLCVAVGAMHDSGVLHRDLKPSNILVTTTGRVMLLDFGLAAEIAARRQSRSGLRIGTPAFMAPEVANKDGAVEASDWYSVGVLLFQALTGRLPFLGRGIKQLHQKIEKSAPPVRSLVPTAPADLSQLADMLLVREPSERPSGIEIRRILGVHALGRSTDSIQGREQETRRLDARFAAVQGSVKRHDGRAGIVVISGESGIGKSALVYDFLGKRAAQEDCLIFTGRCYEQESVPFKTLDDLVDDIAVHLTSLSAAACARLQPRFAHSLMRVFSGFDNVFETTSEIDLSDVELRRRAGLALRDLLHRLCVSIPVVLHIDDIQWGDFDSAQLLVNLLQPPHSPGVLLLCTLRPEGLDGPVPQALNELARLGVRKEELRLTPLNHAASSAVLRSVLGEDPRIGELVEEARGYPLYLDVLAREALRLPQTPSMKGVLKSQLSLLPRSTRQLLDLIVVNGRPLQRAVIQQIRGPHQVEMSRLVRAQLVYPRGEVGEERVEPFHDQVASVVRKNLSTLDRKLLHRELADALDVLDGNLELRFAHHAACGSSQAGRLAIQTAELASGQLAFLHAAQRYEQAVALGEDSWQIRQAIAEAYVNGGRSRAGAEAYLLAIPGAPASRARDFRRRAAEQYLGGGHAEEGIELLQEVLADIGYRLASSPNTALVSFLWQRARLWFRGLGFEEREPTEEERHRVDTLWSVASALSVLDTMRAADFQAKHLLCALEVGDRYRVCRALALEASYCVTQSSAGFEESERCLVRAEALAREVEEPHAMAIVLFSRGMRNFLVGRWPETLAALETAERQLRLCRGVTWELSQVSTLVVDSVGLQGRYGDLRGVVLPRLSEARQAGNRQLEVYLTYVLAAFVRVADDEPEKGIEMMSSSAFSQETRYFTMLDWWRMLGLSFVLGYAGRSVEAWEVWNKDWSRLQRSLLLKTEVMAIPANYHRARLAVAVAAATGKSGFLRTAEAALRGIPNHKHTKVGRAYHLLVEGMIAWHRAEGRAVSLFRVVEEQLTELDMRLHAAVARHRRGLILGGSEGENLKISAIERVSALGFRAPEKIIQFFLPRPSVLLPGWTGAEIGE